MIFLKSGHWSFLEVPGCFLEVAHLLIKWQPVCHTNRKIQFCTCKTPSTRDFKTLKCEKFSLVTCAQLSFPWQCHATECCAQAKSENLAPFKFVLISNFQSVSTCVIPNPFSSWCPSVSDFITDEHNDNCPGLQGVSALIMSLQLLDKQLSMKICATNNHKVLRKH